MRSSRRIVVIAFVSSCSALALIEGCSTGDAHPPVEGDCVGSLCPPSRSLPGSGSSSGADGSAGDSGSGPTDSGGGPIDSGVIDDAGDSGNDAEATDAADDGGDAEAADGAPVDSGGD